MTNTQPIEPLQEQIQRSGLGVQLLQHPLMAQDIWPLTALGCSKDELNIRRRQNLYFQKFSLIWLKQLAKLTVLQQFNEQKSIEWVLGTISVLGNLDIYLRQQGWSRAEDLCDSLLKEFISSSHVSSAGSARKTSLLGSAIRLWSEESWLSISFVPPKIPKKEPKVITIPEEVLHQIYENLFLFPPMLERLFRLQLALGCRIGELQRMPRKCLKQEGEKWYLKRWIEKRKKWEFIQIHPSVAEIIQMQQRFLEALFGADLDFDYLFCSLAVSPGQPSKRMQHARKRFELEPVYGLKPLPTSIIGNWLVHFSKKAELRDKNGNRFNVQSHMFRRTKATIMGYCETEDEFIAAILGHASLDMLPHYRKFSVDRLERRAKQKAYVDMNGKVTTYKTKHTRYEQLHDLIMVHTPLGECHRPSMLGDCHLRYACLNCQHHRVTLQDWPVLAKDRENLQQNLIMAKNQGNTRKITEIVHLLEVVENRLRGLDEAAAIMKGQVDE